MNGKRNIGRRALKWLAIFLLCIVAFLVLVVVLLQTQFGQNIVKSQAENYLRKKLQTNLSIGNFSFRLRSGISLSKIYIEDRDKRILLSVDELAVQYNWDELLKRNLVLTDMQIKGVVVNLHRDAGQEQFNYAFIPAAFVSNDKKSDTTNTSSFAFHLGKLSVDSVRFNMNDEYGGAKYTVSLPLLRTDLSRTDIDKLQFRAGYIFSDGLSATVILKDIADKKEAAVSTSSSPTDLGFVADTVNLSNFNIRFETDKDSLLVISKAASLQGNKLQYQSVANHAGIGLLAISNHSTEVVMVSSKKVSTAIKNQSASTEKPFTFSADSLLLEKNSIVFNDNGFSSSTKKAVDYHHIGLADINMHIGKILFDGNKYKAAVADLSAKEKSGFGIQQLKGTISYSDSLIQLQQVFLKTLQNELYADARIQTLANNYNITAAVNSKGISLNELLYFQPELQKNPYFNRLKDKRIQFSTTAKGLLNKLHIQQIAIKEAGTSIIASADVFNLPDVKKMIIELQLQNFTGNKKDLLALLPPNTIADSLLHYIPERFTAKGIYEGTPDNFYTDVQLTTSSGSATIKGKLQHINDKQKAVYDVAVNTNSLQLGKLLQDSLLGNVSANIVLKGKGYDLKTANTNYDVDIKEAGYKGYTYHAVKANGKLSNNLLETHLQSNDPNLLVTSDTYYDMSTRNGGLRTNTSIQNIDLFKLGFLKDTLILKGNINADLPQLDTVKIEGNILATNVKMVYGSKQYSLDTIKVNAEYKDTVEIISLRSPLADLELTGEYSLQAIPQAAKTILNKYIYTYSTDTVYHKRVFAILTAQVHVPDSMLSIIPGLKILSPFDINAALDTDNSMVAFTTKINRIEYQDYAIDSLLIAGLNLPSLDQFKQLQYNVSVNSLLGTSFSLANSSLKGSIKQGTIKGKLELLDTEKQPRYNIPYTIINDPALPYLKMEDSLLLNKKYWSVADNVIYLNPSKLKGSHLTISRKNESLAINADTTLTTGLPLNIVLNQFKLQNISDMLITDSSLVAGVANGKVTVKAISPFAFSSNLTIDSLKFMEVDAGNLLVDVEDVDSKVLQANIALKGLQNDVTLKGNYNIKDKATDLMLDIQQFNLHTAAPFASKYLSRLDGTVKGEFTLKGKPDSADLLGKMHIDTLQTVYKDYGTYIKIPSADLVMDKHGIEFDEINFTDSAGNKGVITGTLETDNLLNYKYNIKLNTKGFLVIDKRKNPDQLIYGPAYADALVNLKGTEKEMLVDGSVNINDKSVVTYIYSSSETTHRGEGLIEFFDPAHPDDSITLQKKIAKKARGMQMGLNMYVTAKPGATVTIVLDELSGDQLKINGTAGLNLTMNPGGAMAITGNYVVEKGDYDLSIAQLIKKKFSIEKGSVITWSGDPMKADVDITAKYNVKTAAGELVNDIQSVPGIDKQKLNFEVYLMLTKELLKPDIKFRLDMPENEQDVFNGIVYTRIKQVNSIPSELNKQVMGLLAINHFIADNPFSSLSSAGDNFETQAYATAGRLLTDQLTDLVGNAIKGVDIDFDLDVNEDYTSGTAQRNTDLKVGLSKSLADNRLTVYVGSSFALEGQNQNADALSGLAGDVTLEYLLTKDGRYRIKGYRLTENELTFQGSIVKTGVTFVVVLEFNKIKQVFKKKRQKN